eukprot:403350756
MPPRVVHQLFNCIKLTTSKFLTKDGMTFAAKSLLKSVFGLRNLKTLAYRLLTVFAVIMHYYLVEKIDYDQWVHNEYDLLKLIFVWHVIAMNFKILQENKKRLTDEYIHITSTICLLFGFYSLITILSAPILAWFDSGLTQIDITSFKARYLLTFLYIVFNALNSIFPLVRNFMFLISDGIILSQLTSLYLFNELSMSALLTALPILFVVQNHWLIRGIDNFQRDEDKSKLSFVRLVGRHDAVFLFVIYTLFTFLFNIVDFFSTNYIFGINLWYIIYSLYVFGKLMDNKKIGKLRYASFVSIVVYCVIYAFTLQYQTNMFLDRTFPLYNPNPIMNMTGDINGTTGADNSTLSGDVISGNSDINIDNIPISQVGDGGL